MKKLLLLLLSLPILSYGQTDYDKKVISGKVLSIVKKIEKVNILMGSSVGYGGSRSNQYNNYQAMKELASDKELTMLTNHPNAVVRCYAFEALCENKKDNRTLIFDIVKRHVNDEESVERFSGCIVDYEMAGDIMLGRIIYNEYETGKPFLDSLQANELNMLLIQSKCNLYFREIAIQAIEPVESNYSLVKNLATIEKNEIALIKLAEFRKEDDILLFIDYYKSHKKRDEELPVFYSIAFNFPHKTLFPILKNEVESLLDDDHFSHDWKTLYAAIAIYQTPEALEVLNLALADNVSGSIQKYHLDFIEEAIHLSFNPLYDNLLLKLWEDYNLVRIRDYNHLKNINSERAYSLIQKSLDRELVPYEPESYYFSLTDSLQSLMIDDFKKNDINLANTYIIKGIKIAGVLQLPAYLKYVDENMAGMYIEPLFERLLNEDNAHSYLKIVRTLANYKTPEINSRILQIRKKNPAMNENWGSGDLDDLLKEYNIR